MDSRGKRHCLIKVFKNFTSGVLTPWPPADIVCSCSVSFSSCRGFVSPRLHRLPVAGIASPFERRQKLSPPRQRCEGLPIAGADGRCGPAPRSNWYLLLIVQPASLRPQRLRAGVGSPDFVAAGLRMAKWRGPDDQGRHPGDCLRPEPSRHDSHQRLACWCKGEFLRVDLCQQIYIGQNHTSSS
jgi:hypothetical protein